MGQGSAGSGLLRIGTWMKEFVVLRKSGDLGFLWWVSFLFLGMFELLDLWIFGFGESWDV